MRLTQLVEQDGGRVDAPSSCGHLSQVGGAGSRDPQPNPHRCTGAGGCQLALGIRELVEGRGRSRAVARCGSRCEPPQGRCG